MSRKVQPHETRFTHSLHILWRTEGEQLLNFEDKKSAEFLMNELDEFQGNKIVKMELVPFAGGQA